MRVLSPALSILLLAAALGVSARESCAIEEVTLYEDDAQVEVKLDVYQCSDKDAQPLAVFLCGGSVRKEAYESFAAGISNLGYTVTVVDHPVQAEGGPQRRAAHDGHSIRR